MPAPDRQPICKTNEQLVLRDTRRVLANSRHALAAALARDRPGRIPGPRVYSATGWEGRMPHAGHHVSSGRPCTRRHAHRAGGTPLAGRCRIQALVLIVALSALAGAGEDLHRSMMPNYTQNSLGILSATMCGPTAAANVLMYLKLIGDVRFPNDISSERDIVGFINLLGSRGYMNTVTTTGTSSVALIAGMERFLIENGAKYHFETKGWGGHEPHSVGPLADYPWMRTALKSGANLILVVGWYKADAGAKLYRRDGGHFVTCAGFNDITDPLLYINDPGPWVSERVTRRCSLADLDEEYSVVSDKGASAPATGQHALKGIMVAGGHDLAIVDGCIALTIYR
jgi:hypothetical protein